MMKFLRKNQKKILAVFTAGLMIAFIADTGYRRYTGAEREGGRVVGRIGDNEIRTNDVNIAENELRLLLYNTMVPTGSPDPRRQFVSLLEETVDPQIIAHWLERPVTFALLKEEARRIPVTIDRRELDAAMSRIKLRLPDRRVIDPSEAPELAANVRASLADLLLVREAFIRALDVLKVSQPLAMHDAVQSNQTISVRFVRFDAKDRLQLAPEPTDEQLREQFEKYADVNAPEFATDDNPLRFGYRYPQRIRLQYIVIPRDQVKQVVQAKKDDYQWELEANKYYLQNPKEFTSTPAPATQPATEPATQPATRPFSEVREQILERIMTPQVNALADEIRRRIADTMSADYQAWLKTNAGAAGPEASPATQPAASSLGVPYDSYEYLEALAASIQRQYGLLPTTASIGELRSAAQIEAIPEAGAVLREAFEVAEPFVPESRKDQPGVLRLWEPSPPRTDTDGSSYLFRITQADPPHAPRTLDEVPDQVGQDVKKRWAWEQTRAEAQRVLDVARSAGLPGAAGDRPVVTTGPFAKLSFAEIPQLEFDSFASQARFVQQSYQMVSQAATTQPDGAPRPMRLVELPDDMLVLAAELVSVETNIDPDDLERIRLRQPQAIRRDWQVRVMPYWLSYEGVAARLGFVDYESTERSAAALP